MRKIRFVKKCRGARIEMSGGKVRAISCDCMEDLTEVWLRKKNTVTFYVLDEKKTVDIWRGMFPNETPDMFTEGCTKKVDGKILVHPYSNIVLRECKDGGGRGEKRRLCPKCIEYYSGMYDVKKVCENV